MTHKGFAHHVKRNQLIREQQLPVFRIEGDSWWHELWHFLCRGGADAVWNDVLSKAIEDALCFQNVAGLNQKVQGALPKYKDPLEAIQGVAKELRSFFSATLPEIRALGTGQAPSPIDLFDPDMKRRELFGVDWALRFATAVAPALTAGVHQGTQLTQLCIPIMLSLIHI